MDKPNLLITWIFSCPCGWQLSETETYHLPSIVEITYARICPRCHNWILGKDNKHDRYR